ncbi:MAG: NYN domain-containing protein [Polaromonas sp.]|nr:NYN domain-containing protein [Polaromonas sp.]
MSASFEAGNIRQAALLIDADNFADPYAIDTAWKEFQAYAGRISVCRAYGAGPRLQSLWSVWRYLGTSLFPNLSLEKNTTDSALIVDAVALHFQQGIRLFAIASGDADYAPLAHRLREWGCEVWCFSIENIVFRDAETYYDRVRCFPAPVFVPAYGAPVPQRPAMPSAWDSNADAATSASALASAPASAAPPAYRAAPALFSPPQVFDADLPHEVVRILNAVPGLRERPQHLCHVVPVLQRFGFFDKRITKSTAYLAQHSAYFELSPSYKPTLITFLGLPAAASPAQPESALAPAAISGEAPLPLDGQAQAGADGDAAPAVPAPAPSPEDEQALQRIFAAFPRWLPDTVGAVRSLGMMQTLLEEGGVNIGSKPLDALFATHPGYFEMLPADGPAEQVRLLRKPDESMPVSSDSESDA